MPEENDDIGQTDRRIEPFVAFWSSYIHHADEATKKLLEFPDVINRPESLSRAQLDAASKAMDVYLRSSEFLEAIRHSVDTMIAAKKQADGFKRCGVVNDVPDPGAGDAPDAGESTALECETEDHLPLAPPFGEQSLRLWEQFVNVPDRSQTVGDVPWGSTPYDVVYEEGSLRLLRYRNDCLIDKAEPVLVCFSLVNRPYVLDLHSDRSVVRQLLRRGLDVYMIDWGVPNEADHTLRLQDYVCRRMKNVVDVVCDLSDSPQINLLGYCMGGTMSAIYTTLFQRQVRNLILLATPIDFCGEESLLNLWTSEQYFDVDGLIDAFGNCPGSFLRACFQQMKPVQNYVVKYLNLCDKRGDDAFLENFFAMERWANDSVPVAGETFREFVKSLYQQNLLVQGRMHLGDASIDLKRITCPLLVLTANFDHLVPSSSALAITDCVSSSESAVMSIGAGHIGLAVGSRAHRQIWPAAATWIAEHSTSRG